MIYFKSCPRCQGDMHVVNDLYGRYMECLQCGYEADLKQPAKPAPSVLNVSAEAKPKSKVKLS
ncbi:MAG: hypothetical protein HY681_14560 [Chloroflexi bacterium]|nr:hypothetical protein [Chloroflexota bacterium]